MPKDLLVELAEKSILSTDPIKHLYVVDDNHPMFNGVEDNGVQIVCRDILNQQLVISFIKASHHVKTASALATKHRREHFK